MVTDRHEREDVTLVPSRVMKVKVSILDADFREPGFSDIFTLRVQGTNSSSLSTSTFIFICLKVCISRADRCGLVVVFISVLSVEAAWWDLQGLGLTHMLPRAGRHAHPTTWPHYSPESMCALGLGQCENFVFNPNETYLNLPLGVRRISATPGCNIIKNHRKNVSWM